MESYRPRFLLGSGLLILLYVLVGACFPVRTKFDRTDGQLLKFAWLSSSLARFLATFLIPYFGFASKRMIGILEAHRQSFSSCPFL